MHFIKSYLPGQVSWDGPPQPEHLPCQQPPHQANAVGALVVAWHGNVDELGGRVNVAERHDRDVGIGRLSDWLLVSPVQFFFEGGVASVRFTLSSWSTLGHRWGAAWVPWRQPESGWWRLQGWSGQQWRNIPHIWTTKVKKKNSRSIFNTTAYLANLRTALWAWGLLATMNTSKGFSTLTKYILKQGTTTITYLQKM